MTTDSTAALALSRPCPTPPPAHGHPEELRSELPDPPSRNSLLASASQKLADSARRIERLQARLEVLLAQPSNSYLS